MNLKASWRAPNATSKRIGTRIFKLIRISAAALVVAMPAVFVGSPSPAYASTGSITITGHGWGHGRGGGQWGALGYAVQGGWSANQILSHYYSNTTVGTSPNVNIRVVMTENDGNPIIVTDASPFTAAGTPFPAGATVRMIRLSNGSWEIDSLNAGTGSACAVANAQWTPIGGDVSETQAIVAPNTTAYSTETKSNALQFCAPSNNIYLRGEIVAADYSGSPRTVNVVDVEDYLKGVVPSESPAYWGTVGPTSSLPTGSVGPQPAGFQALMVQAVEARSYALSSLGQYDSSPGGPSYADICDSTMCQEYLGMNNEGPVANNAITATAGEVLLMDGTNAIARTEYSASTGGYSAGGTFPAVVDQYDNICIPGACNPNHDWTTTVPISNFESTYTELGTLTGISVTSRNGFGDMGGRVISLNLVGTLATIPLPGYIFAANMGLNSDWFSFSGSIPINNDSPGQPGSTSPSPTSGPGNGYIIDDASGGIETFGDAGSYGSMAGKYLYKPLVGMASTPDGKGYWMVASDGGIFTFGDATFYGSMGGKPLNKPIVGIASTPDGKGYWEVASDGGIFSFGDATFYGSMGGKPLNKPIDGMATTADGRGYWMVASDGGIFTFGDATFYGSLGGTPINNGAWATSFAATKDGLGYYILDSIGRVYTFGDAVNMGDPNHSAGWHSVTYAGITVTP